MPASSPVVDHLYSVLAGGPSLRPNVRLFHLLYAGATRLARTLEFDEVVGELESALQLFVAEWALRRVFVHAGVVGWKGQALILPGRSFTGKSTLVAALLRAGATYYSDEFAVLDARGRVHPYARPLSLRQPDGVAPRRCSAAAFGAEVGTEPLPVGLVALTEYEAGQRWRPRALSPGRAVLALLTQTVPARRQPERALATLQRVVTGARVVKGGRGEADEVAAALLEQLAAGGRAGSVHRRSTHVSATA
jgi:hypothetical protein